MTVTRDTIDDFLAQKSLALVGVSQSGAGFGNAVRKELSDKGYSLTVVHPKADKIGDQPCAHSLEEVAGKVGGVVLVTPPEETEKLVRDVVRLGIPRVWMQQGAESAEAIQVCHDNDVPVIHHECILMFAEPAGWFHRAHRWARGTFGDLPEGSSPTDAAHPEHEGEAHDLLSLEKKLMREVGGAGLLCGPGDQTPVTEQDIEALPEPAQRYLRFMNVVGKPRDWSFRAHFSGRFFFKDEWVPCECAQYNSRLEVARIFHMLLRVKGIVPTYVRDTYLRGRGHMLGKALDWVPVVDEAGEEIAIGECVTYLNDAVLMAPSMLLVPAVQWSSSRADAFDLALTDSGRTVRARVFVGNDGNVIDFATRDRFYAPPGAKGAAERAEWRTPVEGWQHHQGRAFPTRAKAVWFLPTGPLPYVELNFEPERFAFDVPPHA
jgi:predicted CoA-binding protein